ncbi:MAG: T9SS type A sorting domain-containing protein [bacterium]
MTTVWIVALISTTIPAQVCAQELYGCDNSGRLFLVNPATGMGTEVCDLPFFPDPGATEVEYDDLTFRAFVQARDGAFVGRLVDLFTCTPVADMVPTSDLAFTGLEFVGPTLYGTAIPFSLEPSHLMTLDPETGSAVDIGPTGQGPISGLAWDPSTATMYGITGGAAAYGPSKLVTVDLGTGWATVIGETGVSAGGLAFGPDGLLYAAGNNRDGGNLYRIDTADGAASLVGPTGFGGVSGLTLVTRRAITASLDIKPGSCPNPLNTLPYADNLDDKKVLKGSVLPVAVLGSDEFDVYNIDPSTVELVGVEPLRYGFEDLGAPAVNGEECECPSASRDGYMDMTFKFDKQQIVGVIGLGITGEVLPLTMTGALMDGTPFEAVDCVTIISKVLLPPEPLYSDNGGAKLGPAVPNPFNPVTRIPYHLGESGHVRLAVYDVAGRLVTELVSERQTAGDHSVEWRAENLPSGTYFYTIEMNGVRDARKLILLK